jgi:predicted NBD/HSP70 family sugar kinase
MQSTAPIFDHARGIGQRPEDLRHENAALLLRMVLERGRVSRTDLTALTGLSQGTVARQTVELIEAGMLLETDERSVARGRPRVPLSLDTTRWVAVGVHIGLRYTHFSVVDLLGRIVAKRQIEHERQDVDYVVDLVRTGLAPFVAENTGSTSVLGIGVTTAGWVDAATGTVIEHASLGWRAVPLATRLAGLTPHPMWIDRAAHGIAIAEYFFGAAKGATSFLEIFVGSIVDAAFVSGGTMHGGAHSAAGNIAHILVPGGVHRCRCGDQGCVEAEVNSELLVRRAREHGVDAGDLMQLSRRALEGDARAVDILVTAGDSIGAALSTLIGAYDPELVVLSGKIFETAAVVESVRAAVSARVRRQGVPSPNIAPSAFGADATLVASGALALNEFYRAPLSFVERAPLSAARY